MLIYLQEQDMLGFIYKSRICSNWVEQDVL